MGPSDSCDIDTILQKVQEARNKLAVIYAERINNSSTEDCAPGFGVRECLYKQYVKDLNNQIDQLVCHLMENDRKLKDIEKRK